MAQVERRFQCLAASTAVAVSVLGYQAQARTAQPPSDTRVRALSGAAARLLADGLCRSRTMSELAARLERSDVIAYIELSLDPSIGQGQTSLVGATSDARILRSQVSARLTPNRQQEILGHELQHAVEIAIAPHVRDQTSLREHYFKVGRQLTTSHDHETDEAREVERRVKREIAESIAAQPSDGSLRCTGRW